MPSLIYEIERPTLSNGRISKVCRFKKVAAKNERSFPCSLLSAQRAMDIASSLNGMAKATLEFLITVFAPSPFCMVLGEF